MLQLLPRQSIQQALPAPTNAPPLKHLPHLASRKLLRPQPPSNPPERDGKQSIHANFIKLKYNHGR